MIGRLYTVAFEHIQLGAAAIDIFTLINATGKDAVLHEVSLTSEQGVTGAELCRVVLNRPTTDGSAGTAYTPRAVNPNNTVAANMAATVGRSTPGTEGFIMKSWAWSQQGELLWLPTPEIRTVIPASARIALKIMAAIAGGARYMSGSITWEEF